VLLAECSDAYAVGTARLRSKMLDSALKGGDSHVLERAIAARESAQREQFKPSISALEDKGIDLSKLSDFELCCLEAVIENDFQELSRLIEERVLGKAAELARSLAPRLASNGADGCTAPGIDELEVLDQALPVPRGRAIVVAEGRH
jgi:hypothetical protein